MGDVTILLVEDESIESIDIKRTLESFGYQVPYVASNGQEAIDKAFELKPDLILIDINLKGENDGIEAISKIKKLDIPFIYLTAHSEDSTIERAKLTEPAGYIIKPYTPTELKYAIDLAVNKNRIEKELKVSENKYGNFFNHMNGGMAVYEAVDNGEDFIFKNFKRAGENLEHVKKEDVFIGKRLTETFPGVKDFGVFDAFKRVWETGKPEYFPEKMYKDGKDPGSWREIWIYKLPTGEIIAVYNDVTECKKAEKELKTLNKALKKRDEEFRYFIESAPVAIAMFDTRMRYIAASSRWIKDYNIQGIKIHGASHYDIFPEITDELKEVHQRALAGSVISADDDEFIRADGSIQYVRWEVRPWYLSSGDIGGIVIFSEDVSERVKAVKELQDNEEKYRTLFESNPDYTILIGLDGVILDVNSSAANFTNLSKEELIGKTYAELGLFPKKDLHLLIESFANVLKGEIIGPFQNRLLSKEANISWVETQLVPIMKEGNVYSIMVIAEDITHRKTATDQLIKSVNEKDVLLKEIHHRVKNNIQIISSLLNLQKQHVDSDEFVNILSESQNRIKSMAMIHEKLYHSGDLTRINFAEYIETLVSDLYSSYATSTRQVTPFINVENVRFNIETAVPCGLIINELISNSLKHAFPKGKTGTLSVSLKTSDEWNELVISDDGVGFPEEFDIENSKTLGLQLVNILVKQLDGKITLNRINGTRFKIIFKELNYKKRI
ncbi:PAS domain S-box protein [Methanobacterium sp.]|uniref:PAS domain S-box protein n=1 Tax=Methanobacterium sp. TaxID=2164 RepID=UPI0025DADEF4|nr:PAS domain S-box protein [Methanobacterium sp.]MBI5458747.1 PAS domain S-box protein [Methanobacterium sp.]